MWLDWKNEAYIMTRAYRDNFAAIDWSRPIKVQRVHTTPPKRSHLSAPNVIADIMEPVQSMLDGQMYDSKSSLRRTYKDGGVTEVGNDSSITNPKPREKHKPDRNAIKATVNEAFSKAGLGA